MNVDKAPTNWSIDYKMKLLIKLLVFLIIPLLVILVDITAFHFALDISLLNIASSDENQTLTQNTNKEAVYIGVISRFSPQILYRGYQPVMDYLTANTDYHFKLKLSKNYDEAVALLANQEVDAAFLGSFIFVTTRDKYNLSCILKPLNENGQPFLQAALVTTDTSSIFSVKDLVGKRLAMPSVKSFSANWLPMVEFQRNEIEISDLKEIRHFPYHHMVIRQILRGNYDAGVVKDRVAKEFTNMGIRIFAMSDPIPGSPLVVGEHSNPAVVKAITEALLAIKPGDEILKQWDPEFSFGFVRANNEDYDVLEKLMKSKGEKP